MPKMKTKKSAAKRMKVIASGRIRRNKANKRHLLTNRAKDRKRDLRQPALVDMADHHRTKRCLPYG